VTDADLVLGYLDPNFFLGGAMALDIEASRRAITHLGEGLGLSMMEAAAAIHRVVNENMAAAARMHAIERGKDIRPYVIVATGGAGPVHAWGVARSLGVSALVFPPNAGVASSFGMLTAPPSFDFARSLPSAIDEIDWTLTRKALSEMITSGRTQLAATGRDPEDLTVTVGADVRYHGQGGSITVPLDAAVEGLDSTMIKDAFELEYLRLFGSRPPDVDAEVLTWRVRVGGEPSNPRTEVRSVTSGNALKGHRPMWFAEGRGQVEGAVYDRYQLAPGDTIEGPAVVEERESTVVIGPEAIATLNELGNLEVELHG
jgi:N-methylhydantoinase A/oxoprolinase/acetone carboxylase beta subunit